MTFLKQGLHTDKDNGAKVAIVVDFFCESL